MFSFTCGKGNITVSHMAQKYVRINLMAPVGNYKCMADILPLTFVFPEICAAKTIEMCHTGYLDFFFLGGGGGYQYASPFP
jgi:arginine decarboxylase-like protein